MSPAEKLKVFSALHCIIFCCRLQHMKQSLLTILSLELSKRIYTQYNYAK